jgi:hypothetical protein
VRILHVPDHSLPRQSGYAFRMLALAPLDAAIATQKTGGPHGARA